MDKEDLSRINAKLDKHTDMLMEIRENHIEEISLLKLAIQKLKYTGVVSLVVIVLAVGRPELIKLINVIK